jgi:hypothetical protein
MATVSRFRDWPDVWHTNHAKSGIKAHRQIDDFDAVLGLKSSGNCRLCGALAGVDGLTKCGYVNTGFW